MDAWLASGLFEPWRDPSSGFVNYVLRPVLAPEQQCFYYVNDGFSADGRYLWFWCRFPPSREKCCGVLDRDTGTARLCPETGFLDASPAVEPATGRLYWVSGNGYYRREPQPQARVERFNEVPAELIRNRWVKRLSTHITFCSDGASVNVDAELGGEWLAGDLPLDGGPLRIWKRFDKCYNHAQFSPVDPDLQLIAQDGWNDPATGAKGEYTHRMWLLRRDGSHRPLFAEPTPLHGHEWWDASGRSVWYVHYGRGTCRVDLATGDETLVIPHTPSHSHSSACGHYVISDFDCGGVFPKTLVSFYNLLTGRSIELVSEAGQPERKSEGIHLHPHPRFCCGDRYVSYTTTVTGRVSVALAPVDALIAATS